MVCPWSQDGHPDHEAVGRAAAQVAADRGVAVLEYPVWMWHWAEPGDHRVPWHRVSRLRLSDLQRQRKRRAVARHRSQVEPLSDRPGDEALLHPGFLAHFDRPDELFLAPSPASLPSAYFAALYEREGPDPWSLHQRWYEQRKRAVLLAALPRSRYRRAFEPGCATGLLTVELAQRCDEVVALDPVVAAVQTAREHLGRRADVRPGRIPEDWPTGPFDLIVLSEVAYYLSDADLARVCGHIARCLSDDGAVIACHWRHPAPDHPGHAEQVHARLRRDTGLTLAVQHVEDDFLLDVLQPPSATSVARTEGVLS